MVGPTQLLRRTPSSPSSFVSKRYTNMAYYLIDIHNIESKQDASSSLLLAHAKACMLKAVDSQSEGEARPCVKPPKAMKKVSRKYKKSPNFRVS